MLADRRKGQRAVEQLALEQAIRYAIDHEEFELYYQPQVLGVRQLTGVEVALGIVHDPLLGGRPPEVEHAAPELARSRCFENRLGRGASSRTAHLVQLQHRGRGARADVEIGPAGTRDIATKSC